MESKRIEKTQWQFSKITFQSPATYGSEISWTRHVLNNLCWMCVTWTFSVSLNSWTVLVPTVSFDKKIIYLTTSCGELSPFCLFINSQLPVSWNAPLLLHWERDNQCVFAIGTQDFVHLQYISTLISFQDEEISPFWVNHFIPVSTSELFQILLCTFWNGQKELYTAFRMQMYHEFI